MLSFYNNNNAKNNKLISYNLSLMISFFFMSRGTDILADSPFWVTLMSCIVNNSNAHLTLLLQQLFFAYSNLSREYMYFKYLESNEVFIGVALLLNPRLICSTYPLVNIGIM